MKTKSERTFDLTMDEIKAAIALYVSTESGEKATAADVSLKIDGGSPYYDQFDRGTPASVEASVVVEAKRERPRYPGC